MEIQRGQHGSLVGVPGSGKTWFGRNGLLPAFEQDIVVDTEEADFDDWPKVSIGRAIALAKSNTRFHVRVVLEGNGEEADLAAMDQLCYGILKRKTDKLGQPSGLPALAFYVDEVTDFSDASVITPGLKALIRKGRKRGISVLTATQRPAMLNKALLANSRHYFYFAISEYDARASVVHEYVPWLVKVLPEIPYGSYRCAYQAPDLSIVILEPVEAYPW